MSSTFGTKFVMESTFDGADAAVRKTISSDSDDNLEWFEEGQPDNTTQIPTNHLKTMGFKDGLDQHFGDRIQEGFNDGWKTIAHQAFQLGFYVAKGEYNKMNPSNIQFDPSIMNVKHPDQLRDDIVSKINLVLSNN
jgi:hypothetical protein